MMSSLIFDDLLFTKLLIRKFSSAALAPTDVIASIPSSSNTDSFITRTMASLVSRKKIILPFKEQSSSEYSQDVIERYRGKLEDLSRRLKQSHRQTVLLNRRLFKERNNLVRIIERNICNSQSRLVILGSLASGLIQDENTDIDLFYYSRNPNFYSKLSDPELKRKIMFTMATQIEQLGKMVDNKLELAKRPEVVIRAIVPIVRAHFKNFTQIDIQLPDKTEYRFQALRNTNMVKHYVAADERLSQLYHWLSSLFAALGVKKSREGLFSSYQILILVIHFLQCGVCIEDRWHVLPVLAKTHKHLVSHSLPVEKVINLVESRECEQLRWISRNQSSVGELAVKLIFYYSNFDPKNTVINIGTGSFYKENNLKGHIQVFEPYAPKTIMRSPLLPNLLVLTFKFLRRKIELGELLDDYADFSGVADQFLDYVVENTEIQNQYKNSLLKMPKTN